MPVPVVTGVMPALSVGVPVNSGEMENTTLPVPVAPVADTPPIDMLVPKVCFAVQVCAFPRFRDATTDPVVGEIVRLPSELLTELTAPLPVPQSAEVKYNRPVES